MAQQALGGVARPRSGVAGWADAWRAWVAAHPVAVRRLALARTVLLWLGLLHVTLLYALVPEFRPGLRVWLQCYWLLVVWYLLARTKTLPWRAYAGLFAASVPWALVVAWLTTQLAGAAGVEGEGPRTAIAAFGEEALKLVPLAVAAAVVPGRVRRFAAVDWLLAGIACGLGFQAFEDLVRRLVVSHETSTILGLVAGGQGLDTGFPQYGWSPLAGGSSVPGAGYAGHHVFTGLVGAGVGLGVYLWHRRERGLRVAAVALPLLLWWTVVADHLAFNASQAGLAWVEGPDPTVPWPLRAWWEATGNGYGRAWLLLLLLAAALLVDARRLTRGARRGRDVLEGLPFAPLAVVDEQRPRLARGAAALAAFAARDLAFLGAALARDPGEPVRAGLARGRRAATVARLGRLDAMSGDGPPGRVRPLALAAIGAALLVTLVVGPAVADAIGPGLNGGGAWLAGLMERLGDWWDGQSTAEKIAYGAGLAALVALSGGSLGLALGVSGAATWTLDHAHGAATLARDPRTAVRDYVATTTPAGAALDALAFGLTFAPGNFAGAAAGRAVRTALDDVAEDPAAWAARRREEASGLARIEDPAPLTVADFSAIRHYTGHGYARMNRLLRKGDPIPPEIGRRIDALDAALAKAPVREGWVHRGTSMTDAELARYVPGEDVTERQFTSTSVEAEERFAGNVHMIVRSWTGRDISPFSQLPEEREVLFGRDTTFRVYDKLYDREKDLWTIVMAERRP